MAQQEKVQHQKKQEKVQLQQIALEERKGKRSAKYDDTDPDSLADNSNGNVFCGVLNCLQFNSSGQLAKRCKISTEEVKNRLDGPETFSLNALRTYLKMKKGKDSMELIKKVVSENKLVPSNTTSLVSSFSPLLEADVTSLSNDLTKLATRYINFDEMIDKELEKMLDNKSDDDDSVRKKIADIETTKKMLLKMHKQLKDHASDFNRATHGGLQFLDACFSLQTTMLEDFANRLLDL